MRVRPLKQKRTQTIIGTNLIFINNMDFKDYINGLNDFDNQEARTELETFYTLNASVFKYFKAIDSTIHNLLCQPNINVIAKKQLEEILPTLIKLRSEILDIDSLTYARGYKTKIEKAISYIKNQMVVNEVSNNAHYFFELLDDNKDAIKNEKITSEKKLSPLQKAEQIVLKQGVYACSTEMLWKLAWKSKNSQILDMIIREDYEEENFDDDADIDYVYKYYESHYPDAYGENKFGFQKLELPICNSIKCVVALNPQANDNTLKTLANNDNWCVVTYVAANPNTPINVLENLATHREDWVRAAVAKNPNVSIQILQKLQYDNDIMVKRCVAQNPLATNDILKILSHDKNELVSDDAKNNPNYIKSGCFIATACYGDYDAPEVLILRKYRDEHLLTNWLGTLFVKFYYAVSPSIAKHIENSNRAKSFMRNRFLRPIVRYIQCKFNNAN